MSNRDEEEIRKKMMRLLRAADMTTTTERQLREQLQKELGRDLTEKKAFIRSVVQDFLTNITDDADADHATTTSAQKRREHGVGGGGTQPHERTSDVSTENDTARPREGNTAASTGRECILSDPLAAFVGVERMARPQVVKKLWEYIKTNNLQDPTNKRNIIIDEKLATLFTPPMTMFTMHSQLNRHCFTDDTRYTSSLSTKQSKGKSKEKSATTAAGTGTATKRKAGTLWNMTPSEREKAKKAKTAKKKEKNEKEKKKKKKSKESKDGQEGKSKAMMKLSSELAAFVGADAIGPGQLMKFLWAYVKENELQNPTNKRRIDYDAALQKLTGAEFSDNGCCTIMNHIKKHFR